MTTSQMLNTLPRIGAAFDGSTVLVAGLVAGVPCVRLADGRRILGMSVLYM